MRYYECLDLHHVPLLRGFYGKRSSAWQLCGLQFFEKGIVYILRRSRDQTLAYNGLKMKDEGVCYYVKVPLELRRTSLVGT